MIADYFNYSVPMKERMTAVSLFAGVGGFDLALERNGVEVVASAEIDKHARAILAKQFPNQKQFDDVRKVNAKELRDAGFIPERGIITGGFPCQDLSVAGKRAGLAGARSGLFYEIARIADETKAKWLVLENVPGLLTSQRGADMGAVIGTLVDLGYGVAWRVLDAQHFGVPQRRRRVFIVAERSGDPARAAKVLFERQGLRGDPATSGTPRQETTGDSGQNSEVAGTLTAADAEIAFSHTQGLDPQASTENSPTLRAEGGGQAIYTPNRQTGGVEEHADISPTLLAFMGTGGGNVPLKTGTVRRLTPLECERLQGFPDGWTEGQADSHRYKQMGNAVAVPVVEWVIQGLRGDSSTSGTPRQETTGAAGQSSEVAGTLTANGFRCNLNKAATDLVIEPTLYEPHHGDGRATEGIANTLAARMGTGGNNTPVLVEPQVFVKAKRAQNNQDDESWKTDAPHPTLNQFDQGDSRTVVAIVDPHAVATGTVRRLTPLECERLQGFPDGWTEGQADSHRYKQMGNAVAVPVVEWVIQGIMEVGP